MSCMPRQVQAGVRTCAAHREDLASVIPQVEGLVDQVPCHDGGIIAVPDACDAVVSLDYAARVALESLPA